jgi:hypothetical protein
MFDIMKEAFGENFMILNLDSTLEFEKNIRESMTKSLTITIERDNKEILDYID